MSFLTSEWGEIRVKAIFGFALPPPVNNNHSLIVSWQATQ